MNALLLPIVLGFLFLLARKLPQPHRISGAYAAAVAVMIFLVTALGVYSGLSSLA